MLMRCVDINKCMTVVYLSIISSTEPNHAYGIIWLLHSQALEERGWQEVIFPRQTLIVVTLLEYSLCSNIWKSQP